MRQYLECKPLTIFGDGSQVRAFSFIDDMLPCLWRAAIEPAASRQTINLGGTVPVTILEAAMLLKTFLPDAEVSYQPPRHEVHTAWTTHKKSAEILGYEHRTQLGAGLLKMWTWAKAAWEKYPQRREQPTNLTFECIRGIHPAWRDPT
jgi:UDP-glucose 4-epimerase